MVIVQECWQRCNTVRSSPPAHRLDSPDSPWHAPSSHTSPRAPRRGDPMPERVTVADLAAVLHEPKSVLLARVLGTRGEHRCVAILAEALTCEAEGGMRTTDG